jgi:putative transcriptional regulator
VIRLVKNNLKAIRMQEYMLNQKDFAAFLEISPGQYNRYEKGLATPTLDIALRISNKLNRDISSIFCLIT